MTVSRAEDEGLLGISLALDLGFWGLSFSICQRGRLAWLMPGGPGALKSVTIALVSRASLLGKA